MRTCQYLTQDDEEELLHTDYEEFCCQVPGCKATFNQLIDSEFHYASKHTFACSVCRKSLPSFHLLSLHIAENHDSFFYEHRGPLKFVFQPLVIQMVYSYVLDYYTFFYFSRIQV